MTVDLGVFFHAKSGITIVCQIRLSGLSSNSAIFAFVIRNVNSIIECLLGIEELVSEYLPQFHTFGQNGSRTTSLRDFWPKFEPQYFERSFFICLMLFFKNWAS